MDALREERRDINSALPNGEVSHAPFSSSSSSSSWRACVTLVTSACLTEQREERKEGPFLSGTQLPWSQRKRAQRRAHTGFNSRIRVNDKAWIIDFLENCTFAILSNTKFELQLILRPPCREFRACLREKATSPPPPWLMLRRRRAKYVHVENKKRLVGRAEDFSAAPGAEAKTSSVVTSGFDVS